MVIPKEKVVRVANDTRTQHVPPFPEEHCSLEKKVLCEVSRKYRKKRSPSVDVFNNIYIEKSDTLRIRMTNRVGKPKASKQQNTYSPPSTLKSPSRNYI